MSIPAGVQMLHKDLWVLEQDTEYDGLVGTVVIQYYAVEWGASLQALGFVGGAAMPVADGATGYGAGAKIVSVTKSVPGHIQDLANTAKRCVTVKGFEPRQWGY
jgi:hypothetical protein